VRVSRSLRLAIPVENIGEILQLQQQEISPIPGLPRWLLGTINNKGNLLWILHTEDFLGLKPSPIPNSLIVLVVNITLPDRSIRRIACTVFEIEEIFSLDSEQLRPLPEKLPTRARELLQGLAKHNDVFRAVLDPHALFKILNPTFSPAASDVAAVLKSDLPQIPVAI
jgi:chemotaxis signal transduction protein